MDRKAWEKVLKLQVWAGKLESRHRLFWEMDCKEGSLEERNS